MKLFFASLAMLCLLATNTFAKTKADKMLICYFSCSGTTEAVAKQISEHTSAKVIEIKAKELYSSGSRLEKQRK